MNDANFQTKLKQTEQIMIKQFYSWNRIFVFRLTWWMFEADAGYLFNEYSTLELTVHLL